MQRWNDLNEVPSEHGPSVVAIGNFDGVHRGHQAVLTTLVGEARRRDAISVAITFDPHPLLVLHPERAPALIAGEEHKLELLRETGLDAVLVLPFTRQLASWAPERFVEQVLVDTLAAAAVVVGHDIRFGAHNSGDLSTMRRLGAEHGFEVLVLDDVSGVPDPSRRWSSTWVRELLQRGDVVTAAEILGRPHRVTGSVVHGDHRGRELGYPTANLGPDTAGLVPADGVYAGRLVRLELGDDDPERVLPAAISVGTNPTFSGCERRVEAYVLDRDDLELYGERVALDLVERLRATVRFDGVDGLVEQMARDVERARQALGPLGVGRAQ